MKSLLFAAAALPLAAAPARADMGPKPSMEFQIVDHTKNHPAVKSGEQRLCSDDACRKFETLNDSGPQGFRCERHQCWSMAYGYRSTTFQLAVRFDDKVRVSNVFANKDFFSTYTLFIRDDDLLVEKVGGDDLKTTWYGPKLVEEIYVRDLGYKHGLGYWLGFPWSRAGYDGAVSIFRSVHFTIAYALTLLLELAAALLAFGRRPDRRRLLTTVLAANLLSVPALWLYCASFTPEKYSFAVLSSEFAVFLFEGLVLFWFNRDLGVGPALGWSLLFNALSFFGGEFLTSRLPSELVVRAATWRWLQMNPHPNPW